MADYNVLHVYYYVETKIHICLFQWMQISFISNEYILYLMKFGRVEKKKNKF